MATETRTDVVRTDIFHADAIDAACAGKSEAYSNAYRAAMARMSAEQDEALSAAVARAVDRYYEGTRKDSKAQTDTSDRSAALAEQARELYGNEWDK
jgi:hypothetical protein